MKTEEQAFFKGVGAFLRANRQEARISIEEAAEFLGVHKSMISNMENGRTKIALPMFSKLLKFYEVKFVNAEMTQGLK